ncbi:MAG: cell division protein ZapE, partial [Sandaracinobacteroides sp.]
MSGVRRAFDALVATGELRPDPAQAAVADKLERLAQMLEKPVQKPGFLGRLLGFKSQPPVRGAYLWGGVGRGKSMLMDLFFQHVSVPPARRIHFHQFMLETHARIAMARARILEEGSEGDPIPAVAAQWAAEARLLAFDEMQVTNVADAMILSRLFTALLATGTTVVATSNRHPRDLYKDGLNRELFLPFIALLEAELDVIALDGPVDYRLDRIGGMPTYYTPNGPAASAALSELFFRLTDFPVEDRTKVPTAELEVGGGR